MTLATFSEILQEALPPLVLTQGPRPGPTPEGHTAVHFELSPTPTGVRVRLTFGDHPPYLLDFSSEDEAAASLAELFAAVT